MHKVNWAKTEKYHCLFCGCLLINIKGKAESYQLEGGLQCVECCWGERKGFISLLWNMTGSLAFAEAEENHGQVVSVSPSSQRGCTWNHTTPCDQDTSPKSRGNSWKTKGVFYRQKPMAASFPSCLVFMCLRTNFPCKQNCPVTSSSASSAWDRRILPVPTWAQQLLKGEAPQSLSMENSTLKLF